MQRAKAAMLQAIKQATTCEEVARRFSDRVWQASGNTLHFTYSGCGDGSSAYIYTDTDSWWCFSRRMGGDCIDLAEFILHGVVSRGSSPTFRDAINQLLSMGGLGQVENDKFACGRDEDYIRERSLRSIMDISCTYCQRRLREDAQAMLRLSSRGISNKTIDDIRIGLLTAEQSDDLRVKLDNQFGEELVDLSGITTGTDDNRRLLLGGIIIPIIYGGQVRSFVSYKGPGKYIKTRKSAAIDKSFVPFGMDTVTHDTSGNSIFLAEGIFDALSAYESGFPCIATLGTQLSKDSMREVLEVCSRRSVKVVNDYDGSGAGWHAAVSLTDKFLRANIDCYVVRITPELFKSFTTTESKNDTVSNLTRAMSISQFAEIYGLTERVITRKLASVGLSVQKHIDDTMVAVDALRNIGIMPIRSIASDGLLSEFAVTGGHKVSSKAEKLDLNDIWCVTGGSKKAIWRLSENAMPGLQVVIEHTVNKEGKNHVEWLKQIGQVVSQYSLPKYMIEASLHGLNLTKSDIETILKRDTQVNPIVRYAKTFCQQVDVVKADAQMLMCYDERTGVWQDRSEAYYGNILRKSIVPENETIADVWRKVSQEVEAQTYTHRNPFDHQERYIVLANGVYDTLSNLFLPEFSKQFYATTYIPIMYRANDTAPKFKNFLRELFIRPSDEGDEAAEAECENKIAYIEELIGLLMCPDNSFQVFWTFLGEGGNGKTSLQNLIFSLLGGHNVSTISLSQLSNRFATYGMLGKLLNITSEKEHAPSDDVVEVLKRIVGNEPVQIEAKYMPSFSTVLNARFIVSANKPIKWPQDGAMERRQRNALLEFPCRFTDEITEPIEERRPINRNVLSEVLRERSGILNLALAGLSRLRQRKQLRTLDTENQILRDVSESSDVNDFFFSHLHHSPVGLTIKSSTIYDMLVNWWRNQQEDGKIRSEVDPPARYGQYGYALRKYVSDNMKGSKISRMNSIGRPEVVTKAVLTPLS